MVVLKFFHGIGFNEDNVVVNKMKTNKHQERRKMENVFFQSLFGKSFLSTSCCRLRNIGEKKTFVMGFHFSF